MILLHEAIRKLNPSIVTIRGEDAFDKDDNPIEFDLDEAKAEVARNKDAEDNKKKASLDKLAKLGLTPDDLKALLG